MDDRRQKFRAKAGYHMALWEVMTLKWNLTDMEKYTFEAHGQPRIGSRVCGIFE